VTPNPPQLPTNRGSPFPGTRAIYNGHVRTALLLLRGGALLGDELTPWRKASPGRTHTHPQVGQPTRCGMMMMVMIMMMMMMTGGGERIPLRRRPHGAEGPGRGRAVPPLPPVVDAP
jgi:hypothetical protein